jgi:hypothetical protein
MMVAMINMTVEVVDRARLWEAAISMARPGSEQVKIVIVVGSRRHRG